MASTAVTPVLESKNFFVSALTLVFMFLASNDIFVDVTPTELVDKFNGGSLFTIIVSIIIPNLFNPVMKIIQKIASGTLTTDFLKSTNFWTQFITVILMSTTLFLPLEFPADASTDLVSAWDAGFIPFLGALVINIVNPIYHFFKDKTLVLATPEQTDAKKIKISNN